MIELALSFAVLSAINYSLYALDKKKAQDGEWRIPEKILLTFSVFGGALGGLLSMRICRHKTKKWYFWFVNWLALFAHLVLLYLTR